MEFPNLTEEQKARALACSNADELIALAHEEGIELTDEQLEAVSGGGTWSNTCGNNDGYMGQC